LLEERVLGGGWLNRAYGDGRPPFLTGLLFNNGVATWLMGKYTDSLYSAPILK